MKKRLLLTGIGGSIGIHTLSQIMKNTDWEVVGIDSFRHKGWCDRVATHLAGHPQDVPRVKIITHDLTAPFSDLTKKRIGHVDYIINMASLSDVEDSLNNPVPFCINNVTLMLYMLEYARDVWGLRNGNTTPPEGTAFIQISTDEVYGPTKGKNDGYKEWDAKVSSNPYSGSKSSQEEFGISWWRAYGVPLIITNTMNNYGEMQSGSKYPVMIQKALMKDEEITIHGNNKGESGSRSYIHSQNFANALLFILKNLPPHLHVPAERDFPDRYHIAGEKQLDNLELAQLTARLMGKKLKYKIVDFHKTRPGHDPHYGLNDEKIRKLGWKEKVPFEESYANTIKWQSENPDWIN